MIRSSLLLAILLHCVVLAGAFEDKIDAKLLIGKWEFDNLPDGLKVKIEFMKDSKVKYVAIAGGNQETLEGSYKVEGNILTTHTKKNGNETTKKTKIIKLSEKECTTIDDDRGGEQTSMKKLP